MKEKLDCPVRVLENYFRSSDSETSSSKEPAEIQDKSKPSRWGRFFQLLKSKSNKHSALSNPMISLKVSWKSSGMTESKMKNFRINSDMQHQNHSWKSFSLHEIQTATNCFNPENLIGKGGYAEVYKGRLRSGQLVAIKRLTRGTHDEVTRNFLSEFGIMAHVYHPNTAKLIGYGVKGGMYLVLELSKQGSLASLLYGSKENLPWRIRYQIALGVANGLLYLHEGCQRRIIHRDIKAANILLTDDFQPQICDFGLAKWLPKQWSHLTVSEFEGTFGYHAPEYLLHGIVDEKTDVFAFGVLLLELVTSRRALNHSQQNLVLWAKPLLKKNAYRELIDPSLANGYDPQQTNLVFWVASLCIQQTSIRRPSVSQVVQLLNGRQP